MDIPVISWFDEPIKKSVNSVFSGINKNVEAMDLFKRYRKSHFQYLRSVVQKVKVLGMSEPIPLADLYYPVQVSPEIQRRLYLEEWVKTRDKYHRSSRSTNAKLIDGAACVESSEKLVILGGPGAGKTTFLKFLALAYSDKEIFGKTKLKTSRFPFYCALPEVAKSDKSLVEFISAPLLSREDSYAGDFIKRLLKKGLAIVLLDSLDEVPSSRRDKLMDRVREFCNIFPENKVVISCRAADYRDVLDGFSEVELARLSKEAIRKIVRSWFQNRRSEANRLLGVIDRDEGLASLTETPLLLSLLCIQFRHDLVLPRRKAEIYRRCIETLLREWDAGRGFRRSTAYESLSDDHKERLFEHVAGISMLENQAYVLPKAKVCEITSEYIEKLSIAPTEAPSVLNEIESHHGIIEQYAYDAYCFSHASVQDYFVARYAIAQRLEMSVLKSHLEDEPWAAVIEFMCALHPDPEGIFRYFEQKASLGNLRNYPAIERRGKLLFLMYRCLTLGPVLSPSYRTRLFNHISESIKNFSEALAESGVFPMCAFDGSGVRQVYLFSKSRRKTLHDALLPFRKLFNEVLETPVKGFSDHIISNARGIMEKKPIGLISTSVLLNFVIPLSKTAPNEVLDILADLKGSLSVKMDWLSNVIDESVTSIRELS